MTARRVVRREVDEALISQGDWPSHWPPALRRVHAARGSTGLGDAMPGLGSLPPPDGLLGLPQPVYRHHGLVLDDAGQKLSKSTRSTALRELRAGGMTPDEVRGLVGIKPTMA